MLRAKGAPTLRRCASAMKPVLFISHSSKDSDRAKLLAQALDGTGSLRTTIDLRDLKPGSEYQPQLFQWMARCQGGVLLLTESAMHKGEWVLLEASVLRARSILEGDAFRLFAIVEPAVRESEVWNRWFAPLGLDRLQQPRVTVLDAPGLPAGLADAIALEMQDVADHGSDYFSLLATSIEGYLADILQRADARRLLEDQLELEDATWETLVGGGGRVPALLARRLCRGDFGRFQTISNLFNRLQAPHARHEQRRALLSVLRSYWVPLEGAARLAVALEEMKHEPAADAAPPRNMVLIETGPTRPADVANMHRERQFTVYGRKGHWIPVCGGNESAQSLEDEVMDQLRQFYGANGLDEAELLAQCREDLLLDQYVFIHVPAPAVPDHVLSVAGRIPCCLFLVTAPAAVCAELAARLKLEPVRPLSAGLPQAKHLMLLAAAEHFADALP